MAEAFNHLNKVKCRETQLAWILPWDIGEGRKEPESTISSSWRGLGPREAAWSSGGCLVQGRLPGRVGVLGTIKSKLGTHGCN